MIEADYLVIGAGIAGASTGYWLSATAGSWCWSARRSPATTPPAAPPRTTGGLRHTPGARAHRRQPGLLRQPAGRLLRASAAQPASGNGGRLQRRSGRTPPSIRKRQGAGAADAPAGRGTGLLDRAGAASRQGLRRHLRPHRRRHRYRRPAPGLPARHPPQPGRSCATTKRWRSAGSTAPGKSAAPPAATARRCWSTQRAPGATPSPGWPASARWACNPSAARPSSSPRRRASTATTGRCWSASTNPST